MTEQPRDSQAWAGPVSKLSLAEIPAGATGLNVEGRRVVSPLQGFGQLWQKTYRVRLSGVEVAPAEVIRTWKADFSDLWPEGARFYAPLAGIKPGEVATIQITGPAKLPLSTGVMVIYADDESFTFMNPEGHIFAGWITFSAYEQQGAAVAQIQVLVRANDPIWEIFFRLFGSREDEQWHAVLQNLAGRFGVRGQVQQEVILVDAQLQWSQAKNIWHNAGIRSGLAAPFVALRKLFGRSIDSS